MFVALFSSNSDNDLPNVTKELLQLFSNRMNERKKEKEKPSTSLKDRKTTPNYHNDQMIRLKHVVHPIPTFFTL